MHAWLIWLIAGLFYLYEFIHRLAPSVMIPELMADFSVNATVIGSLSAYYYYAYSAAQLPVGIMLDRFGSRKLLTAAAAAVCVGSFILANTQNILLAKLCRSLIGFGSAFSFVSCLKLGAAWFPASRFGLIVGLTNLLGVSGAILGSAPLASWINHCGWRQTINNFTIIGIVITALIWLIVRDAPASHNQHYQQQKCDVSKTLVSLKQIFLNPQYWFIALFATCMVAPIAAYSELWGVAYLMEHYQLNKPVAAQISSMTFIGIAAGGPLFGMLSDNLRRYRFPMMLGSLLTVILTTLLFYLPPCYLPLSVLGMLHLLFGATTSCMLLSFSLSRDISQPQTQATAVGFINTLIMGGSACFQYLTSYILDVYYVNYKIAFFPLTICNILAVLMLFFIREKYDNC